jgi:hypothetical protein
MATTASGVSENHVTAAANDADSHTANAAKHEVEAGKRRKYEDRMRDMTEKQAAERQRKVTEAEMAVSERGTCSDARRRNAGAARLRPDSEKSNTAHW